MSSIFYGTPGEGVFSHGKEYQLNYHFFGNMVTTNWKWVLFDKWKTHLKIKSQSKIISYCSNFQHVQFDHFASNFHLCHEGGEGRFLQTFRFCRVAGGGLFSLLVNFKAKTCFKSKKDTLEWQKTFFEVYKKRINVNWDPHYLLITALIMALPLARISLPSTQ